MIKYPSSPVDGDQITADNGSIWQYSSIDGSWRAIFGSQTIATTVPELRTQLKHIANKMCATTITSGFVSSDNFYPSTTHDQQNYALSITSGAQLWTKVGDTWQLVKHTAEQVSQIAASFSEHRSKCSEGLYLAIQAIEEATTVEDLQSIDVGGFFK